jgi:hypothetical protein
VAQPRISDHTGVRIGLPVFSNDGFHLGHVKDDDPGLRQFKVDAPEKPDYWLPYSEVVSARSGYVLLALTRSEAIRDSRLSANRRGPYISSSGSELGLR